MTRTMYDGINADAASIFRDHPGAQMIAYYITGNYAWTKAEIDLFPHAAHVTIVTTATANAGDVLDVEAGDAAPGQTAGWIAMRKANGLYRPTIYCSLSAVSAVRVGTGRYRLGADYDLWVADWDGKTTLDYPLEVAKQYATGPTSDTSVVFSDAPGWPYRTAPVVTPPPPVTLRSVDITALFSDGSKHEVKFP